ERRADVTGRVGHGEGVGEMVREPAQRRASLLRRLAGLEQVADDEWDAEAAADDLAATEGERHREAGVADPVQKTPGAVARADHGSRPGRVEDRPFEPLRGIVVIPREDRAAGAKHSLRA